MTAFAEQVVGIWSGCAFPTQETTLVFCQGGQGLLFFYLGSDGDTPFVDEFLWSVETEARLKIRWLSRHEYSLEWEEEETEEAQDLPLLVTSGAEESVSIEMSRTPGRALRLSLGMHDFVYSDTWLAYQSAPGNFAQERERLQTLAENFDPFGPDRQVWLVGDGHWRKALPGRDAGRLGLNRTRSVLSFLFFGALGQTLLWTDPILSWTTHRGWVLLPLLFLPLFAVFREDYFPGTRWHRVCLLLQMLLSALYLSAGGVGLALALSPVTSPAGRSMHSLTFPMTALGAVPCVYLLWTNPHKMRTGARVEATLAETFRGWRAWRVHDMNVWLLLSIMTGISGEMLFLLGFGTTWLSKWPRILLHCIPALIVMCDEGEIASPTAQKFGALWYVAVWAVVIVAFAHGWRPSGWPYLIAATMFGIPPCVYAWRKPRQEAPHADTFRSMDRGA